MPKSVKVQIRYSISFKQKVVQEIEEEGLTLSAAQRRYGIKGGSTIQGWIKAFGKYHLLNKTIRVETKDEKDRLKEMEKEIKHLKSLLVEAYMGKACAEKVIELADKEYKTDLKKTFGSNP